MQIDLTVRRTEGDLDVRVEGPPGTPLTELRAALLHAYPEVGDGYGARLCHGAVLVGADGDGNGRDQLVAAAALHVVGGRHAGTVVPLRRNRVSVGRGTACDLVLDDPGASRVHAEFDLSGSAPIVRDLDSTNGTVVLGVDVDSAVRVTSAGVELGAGDVVGIGETLLRIGEPTHRAAAVHAGQTGTMRVLRPPRSATSARDVTVDIPEARPAQAPRPVQWLTALVPVLLGCGIAWYTGSSQFLLFALLSPVVIVSGALGDRVSWRRSRRVAARVLRERSDQARRETDDALRVEAARRRERSPDPATVSLTARIPTVRLWERQRRDDDLLELRVGTGPGDSVTAVRSGSVTRPAGRIDALPICADLRDGPLGVVGPAAFVDGLGRTLLCQLAVLCSPRDVPVTLVLSERRAAAWHWARWLPHVVRPAAADHEGRTAVLDAIADASARVPDGRRPDGPRAVVIVDRIDELADLPGLERVMDRAARAGTGVVVLADRATALPAGCASVAAARGDSGVGLLMTGTGTGHRDGIADLVDEAWAEQISRALAPLVDSDDGRSAVLPEQCGLAELHGHPDAGSIGARWRAAGSGARMVLGLGGEGSLAVDLATDGPHVLVAGTTGAGKSDLLQTMVASLAVHHPPTDLTVLLVDYKGGAAFGRCAQLPHAAGLVTDLDPYLTERALRGLRAELRRREALFEAVGASDLSAYRRVPGAAPVPRLVIVVDEFAALAQELPDFVPGLVAVAARGRSLGVHLVLATQRPGSAVTPDIRANTSLRICLRVTDQAESADVLGVADAAAIGAATPGRGFVRDPSGLRAVQVAWPGATAGDGEQLRVLELGDWRMPVARPRLAGSVSDLDQVVAAVRAAADDSGFVAAAPVWALPLPAMLTRADLPPVTPDVPVLGLVDRPDESRVDAVVAGTGSMLVVGGAGTGRTSVLAGCAVAAGLALPPVRLEIHTVAPRGQLARLLRDLPHCTSTIDSADVELVLRLLTRLVQECERRARSATDPGRIMLLLDDWDALTGSAQDMDAVRLADLLADLLRAGPAAGLMIVLAGGRDTCPPRLRGLFERRVVLRLGDPGDYAAFGVPPALAPAAVPGHGVLVDEAAVAQFARVEQRDVLTAAGRWPIQDRPPGSIAMRALPRTVSVGDLRRIDAGANVTATQVCLGIAGDDAAPLWCDLFGGADRLLIAGPPRSGRSTLLRAVHRQLSATGVPVVVIAGPRSPLRDEARGTGSTVLDPRTPVADGSMLPRARFVVLADDCTDWLDSEWDEELTRLARTGIGSIAVVAAGRSDDLATTYRGLGAEVRRSHCGVLLRPGPVDGELLGTRLARRTSGGPPGRGVVVGHPGLSAAFEAGDVLPIQAAAP